MKNNSVPPVPDGKNLPPPVFGGKNLNPPPIVDGGGWGGETIPANLAVGAANGARLLENLTSFARILRKLNFAASAQQTADAGRALAAVGMQNRDDVFWALAAVFVGAAGEMDIFRQAFAIFWRAQKGVDTDALPAAQDAKVKTKTKTAPRKKQLSPRLLESLGAKKEKQTTASPQADAALTVSDSEVFRNKDFEQMNAEEWAAAAAILRRLRPLAPQLPTRRRAPATVGALDLRRSARAGMRTGGTVLRLLRGRRKKRCGKLVVIADISGSMSAYARMFAHCIAAVAGRGKGGAFLFGTSLSPVVFRNGGGLECAVAAVAKAANDWEGGTRIGESLAQFNRRWSRRVLPQGAAVLLATDGLERGGGLQKLARETERLRRSCRALIWLNPLLRCDDYRPEAAGAKILYKNADAVRSIHNIKTITELASSFRRKPESIPFRENRGMQPRPGTRRKNKEYMDSGFRRNDS